MIQRMIDAQRAEAMELYDTEFKRLKQLVRTQAITGEEAKELLRHFVRHTILPMLNEIQ